MITFDTNLLYDYYQARAGVTTAGVRASGPGAAPKNPTPPWSANATGAPAPSQLVRSVMAGGKFINPGAAKIDVPGSSADYRKMFGLYMGLVALQGVADQMTAKGIGDTQKANLRARFDAGMRELAAFLDTNTFENFQLSQGTVVAKAAGTVGVKRPSDVYVTGVLHTGSSSDEVAAFQGDVRFSVTATLPSSSSKTVEFDLAEMGATPRTMSNVVLYLNEKLEEAGVSTRFANLRTPGGPRTTQVGGQTITLGTEPDSYSLQIKGVSTETLTFNAQAAGPAVYLGGLSGPGPQLLTKYGTDPAVEASLAADGKVYAKALAGQIQSIRQTRTGSDGSVYVLADVNGAVAGQTIKGMTDVALLKYDSAGNLVYARTLGAGTDAAGYALEVSADGSRVAVAGSVTGALDFGDTGADAKTADSFLTVFDSEGRTLFSDRFGAAGADQVQSVAFGDDGSVYVAGTTESAMAGASAVGGQDAYIRGYKLSAPGAPLAYTASFTTQYGTTGLDRTAGVAVSGSTLVVAGVENGEAIVRRYDLQPDGAPVLGEVRSLGALQGTLAGVTIAADGSVIVAGTTSNGAVSAGTVTTAYEGGQAVFVAKLSADLTASADDRLSFYGGGDRSASALTVADGQVYVTGQIKVAPPPGQTTAFDGYAAAIDPETGAVGWNVQYRGGEGQAAPASIAVDATGASVLDRIGLPTGTIDWSGSQLLTAATSVRPGDQFYIRGGSGPAKAITIEADDTLRTLADKVNRALGFTAKVEVVIENGYDRLQITPLNSRNPIEIDAGKMGRDALRSLGLPEGLIAQAPDPKKKEKPNYGLELPSSLSLITEGRVKQAQAQLTSALSKIRTIYRELTAPPPSSAPVGGPVPAYLTEKIANYQRALARLGG